MSAERDAAIRRMRAIHSQQSRGMQSIGPWTFRESCTHHREFVEVDERWERCPDCWWCRPRLGHPPKLEKLPAILKGRPLPPLSGEVDVDKLYANAGFVLSNDASLVCSMVRVVVVQHSWAAGTWVETSSSIRRCGAEVRFKDLGWKEAAVFMETQLHRLVDVLGRAEPRKPRGLWLAIQRAFGHTWARPWS